MKNNMKIQPSKTAEFVGFTSGRLTVISFDQYKPKKGGGRVAYWNCKCKCGTESISIHNAALVSKNGKSCGCLTKERIIPNAPFLALLATYKRGAKGRQLEWSIDKEQFKNLTSNNCYYCGEPPSKIKNSTGSHQYKGLQYTYNGIDRIDNTEGYSVKNSISCCWLCNLMKGSLNQSLFITKALNIAKHHIKAELSTGLIKA